MRVAYLTNFIDCENYEDLEKNKWMLEPGIVYHVKFSKPFGTDGGAGCDCVYNENLDALTYLKNPICGFPDWYIFLPHKGEEKGYFKDGWLTEKDYHEFFENYDTPK